MAQEGCQVLEAKQAREKAKELEKEVEVRSKKSLVISYLTL